MALVNKRNKGLSIHRQCELLDLPRSSYYYKPAQETEQNVNLMRQIDELHLEHPYYGVLRMRAQLSTEQYAINEKRIRRLMRKMGIEAIYPKRNLSKPCKWHLRFPYLLRGLEINRPNQVWSMDITYIPMKQGFMYLCAVIDWHSRYLLSWKLSNTLTTDFCIDTLDAAITQYGAPQILNTDQGSQFTSDAFIEKVLSKGIRFSMDGKGRATDNITIERFWRSLKYENIYLYGYENNLELHKGINKYIYFYNQKRKHQGLKEQTPAFVYQATKAIKWTITAFPTENFLYGPASFVACQPKNFPWKKLMQHDQNSIFNQSTNQTSISV
jgi:putative transposase